MSEKELSPNDTLRKVYVGGNVSTDIEIIREIGGDVVIKSRDLDNAGRNNQTAIRMTAIEWEVFKANAVDIVNFI